MFKNLLLLLHHAVIPIIFFHLQQYVCKNCGDLLSCFVEKWEASITGMDFGTKEWTCKKCGTSDYVVGLDLPYVFRYLCAELAAVNIKVKMRIEEYD